MNPCKSQSIYLMKFNNLYKIGISNDPEKRYKTFLTGNPKIKLVLYSKPVPFAYELEQKLHKIFFKESVSGEWFKLKDPDINNLIKLLENLNDDPRTVALIESL